MQEEFDRYTGMVVIHRHLQMCRTFFLLSASYLFI